MSQLALIRSALVALLQAVPNIGVVHAFERYTREEAKFRELFTYPPTGTTRQVRGWWLRRIASRERGLGVGRTEVVHTWHIRAYLALSDADASELLFDELIEAVRDAVRLNPGLGGLCTQGPQDGDADGVQLLESGPVNFCGALCHSAVLEFKTWSYL